jgi:hypothetical protein
MRLLLLMHMDDETIDGATDMLRAAGVAQAADESLDIEALAHARGSSVPALTQLVEQLEHKGLLLSGLDEGLKPILRNAGRQYLKRGGDVARPVLNFLPRYIDDLYAREAFIHAGTTLVDEFRAINYSMATPLTMRSSWYLLRLSRL